MSIYSTGQHSSTQTPVVSTSAPEPVRSNGAESLLRRELAAGACEAAEIRRAADRHALAWRTVQEVAKKLGVHRVKKSMAGGWTWSLPAEDADEGAKLEPSDARPFPPSCIQTFRYEIPEMVPGILFSLPAQDGG